MDPQQPATPKNSPFSPNKELKGKFGDFNDRFEKAKIEINNRFDSIVFRRVKEGEGDFFEIEIRGGHHTFIMRSKPFITETRCFNVEKSTVFLHHDNSEEDGVNWQEDDNKFNDKYVMTALKLLNHFAMIGDSVFEDAQIVLPSKPAGFRVRSIWNPRILTVTVDESMVKKNFVYTWLNHMLPASGVESLTINSPHRVFISSGRNEIMNMEKITNLTIIASAEINWNFISRYRNMNIIYNDPNSDSPITHDGFLSCWLEIKDLPDIRKRIEFICKHKEFDVNRYKDELQYQGGVINPKGISASEGIRFTKTFEADENRLIIDINTTEGNNGGNPPN